MCLLMKHPEGHSFDDSWLTDFYTSNQDGLGIMWAEDGELRIRKLIPNKAQDVIDFYREHADGRECAIHFRMMTHGDIDLNNCHPYKVFSLEEDGYDLWLMHNGVLSTGNYKDTAKSDTWHFINDVIKPALRGRPHEFVSPWFKLLIEEFLGSSNKFIMMDHNGVLEVFNEDAGVMWGDVWMSNTYAWSASKAGVKSSYASYWGKSYGYGNRSYDDWDYSTSSSTIDKRPSATVTEINTPKKSEEKSASEDALLEEGQDFADKVSAGYTVTELAYDAEQWTYLMYDMMDSLNWYEAYRTILDSDLSKYYMHDEQAAWGLLGGIEEGQIQQDDLIAEIDRFTYNRAMDLWETRGIAYPTH